MTYNDIIKSINYKIENSNFERFPIEHVIDELNNTYRDLANKTEVFETADYLMMDNDIATYTLPNRIYRPTRATYRGTKIDFVAQEAMDSKYQSWELETTEYDLEYIVYNNLSERLVTVYPMPTNIGIDYTSDIAYLGELSDVSDLTYRYLYASRASGAKYLSDVSDPHGTISDLNLREVITVYGIYLPPILIQANLESDNIYLDETNVNALIYGTAGNLLFTSGRTEDAAKATNYMKLYGVDETEVGAIRKQDFTGGIANTKRNQNYRTPFKR